MAYVENKFARANYDLLETFEAGIELLGTEVKSLRTGHGSLRGAFVGMRGGEPYLIGASIPAYQPGNVGDGYDDLRPRRLLLSRAEIARLIAVESEKGLTLVPLSMYNKGRFIKLSFALAKGLKKHDKRRVLRDRDDARSIERTLKYGSEE